ncbi:hypothetical protein B0H17DRAFT_1199930 [Mycena rosella]|uniref:Glucose-methanol-choline oxidoreductase N-terminal domain-containing protein n=1 Tax=Mycena rosella TaxID=1033263 RepID=A0AAD7GJA3_MYCRO|nr:hypothetical protein B0H17DRAFT_1199930 [Mycena rosella]
MVYTRGSKEDFDRFARVAGDEHWVWDNLIAYMRKSEEFTAPVDHHNTTGQFNPTVHGFNGMDSVTLAGFANPIGPRVIETTREVAEFPFNLDMNSGNQASLRLRNPDTSSIFDRFPDSSTGPNTSHYELIISNGSLGATPPTGNYLWITSAVVSPKSISSRVIPPTYLPTFIMRYAVRSALRFAAARPCAGYVVGSPPGSSRGERDEHQHSVSPKGAN